MDSDVNIPLTSPAFSCPDVSNCSSGQVFGTSTPSELWDFFPFIFYKECSRQHFITATSLLLVPGRQSAQRFEMVLCPFVMQEGWSEVFEYFFFSFWLNKQPCFWKAGSSVSLCTKRATKLKQQQWTAVCQVCENIYFCIIIFYCCWLDVVTPCTNAILESVNSKGKRNLKLSFPKDSPWCLAWLLVGGGLLMTYSNW